jgi:hypothetical protein
MRAIFQPSELLHNHELETCELGEVGEERDVLQGNHGWP